MKYPLWSQEGKKIGEVALPEKVFRQEMNEDLIHQAVLVEEANSRQVIAHTKNRSEVSGGGRKPWRQKGTGRARVGSNRSPIWIGGGITFGPRKTRIFRKKLNQKMRAKALAIALSDKVEEKSLKVVDNLSLPEGKTKLLTALLASLKLEGTTLLLLNQADANIIQAGRNLFRFQTQLAQQVTAREVLKFKNLLLVKPVIEVLKKRLS